MIRHHETALEPVHEFSDHFTRAGRFLDAIADPTTAYVRRSKYYSALEPYLARFEEDQLIVLSMEEVVAPPYIGWYRVLESLGVPPVPPDGSAVNVTSEKERFSRLGLRLWESGWLNRVARVSPPSVRRVARQVLLADTARYRRLLESADAPVPSDVAESLNGEVERTEAALGYSLGFDTK